MTTPRVPLVSTEGYAVYNLGRNVGQPPRYLTKFAFVAAERANHAGATLCRASVRVSAASTRGCARSRPDRTALRRKPRCAGTSAGFLRLSAGSMARPGSTRNCAARGTDTHDAG